MFRKPFKVKSNSQIKGSERKLMKDQLLKAFPKFTETDLEDLLPKKETINIIKLITANNRVIQVFTVAKRPMFFEITGTIFPTVYLLWKYPDLIASITTHPQVMGFINSGADLMAPGVVTPPSHTGLSKYGNLNENSMAFVNLSNNKAAVAVGIAAQSSNSMLTSGGKGKCLLIHHFYGDKLCGLDGLSNLPLPNMGAPEWLMSKSYDEDFPALGPRPVQVVESPEKDADEQELPVEEILPSEEKEAEAPVPDNMDDLFNYCFFTAIKYSKTLTLPILTSNFYKLQMMPNCPPDQSLDIKKTTFKKLKPFLDFWCKEGVITVSEMKKGVESIVAINRDHPKFNEFYVEPALRPKKAEDGATNLTSTSITESYIITQNVLPIFADSGLTKGATVQMPEIRKYVTEYVRKHECQDIDNKKFIRPKEALITICKTENNITWEELMEKVCESMKNCFKVSSGNDEIVNKGKVSPIMISVSTRSGNKKVTLIDNLELFGIRVTEFAKECQHGVAASTSISKPVGKKCDQLLVQGNQTLFVHDLLTEKYKIPARYIRGLENAPKKKK